MESSGINLEDLLQRAAHLLSTWGLRVVGALVLLVVGWTAAKMVRGSVRKALAKSKMDKTLVPFLANLVYYLLLTFVGVAVLSLFGIETTSLIAFLGAAGLAVGLALQGTLSNFAAGVMLLIFRPFQVGDFVEAAGTAGAVQEIGIFSISLSTPDNVMIVVPNATVYGQIIKNYTANDTRRNDMVIGIGYGDDIGKALTVIEQTLQADARVLKEPQPLTAVSDLGESSVNLVVRPWCRKEDYWGLRFDMMRLLKENLEAAGCSIPFPQRDVHLFQEPGTAI